MGHSLLPEVFQNYWPSCAQKNLRILDESLKKKKKKSWKTPPKLCSLFFRLFSLCNLTHSLNQARTVRFVWQREKIEVPYIFQPDPTKQEAAHLQLSPRQTPASAQRSKTTNVVTYCTITTKMISVFKLAFLRITRVQCNTSSLLEAWDTRVRLEDANRSLSVPPATRGTGAPFRSLLTFKGQIKTNTDLHRASGSRNVWETVGLSAQTNHHLLKTLCFWKRWELLRFVFIVSI